MNRLAFLYFSPLLLLTACGSGAGGGSLDMINVQVTGSLENVGPKPALKSSYAAAFADTPRSILNASAPADMDRLADVSQGSDIRVTINAHNLSDRTLTDLTYEIGIEDAVFITPEYWICYKRFSALSGGGEMGIEVWTEYGGMFYNTTTPPVTACAGPPKDAGFICDKLTYDCASPWWAVSYNPPGTGLWPVSGTVSELKAGEIFTSSASMAHSATDIRPDKLSYFSVRTSDGQVLAEQFYMFDVVP